MHLLEAISAFNIATADNFDEPKFSKRRKQVKGGLRYNIIPKPFQSASEQKPKIQIYQSHNVTNYPVIEEDKYLSLHIDSQDQTIGLSIVENYFNIRQKKSWANAIYDGCQKIYDYMSGQQPIAHKALEKYGSYTKPADITIEPIQCLKIIDYIMKHIDYGHKGYHDLKGKFLKTDKESLGAELFKVTTDIENKLYHMFRPKHRHNKSEILFVMSHLMYSIDSAIEKTIPKTNNKEYTSLSKNNVEDMNLKELYVRKVFLKELDKFDGKRYYFRMATNETGKKAPKKL